MACETILLYCLHIHWLLKGWYLGIWQEHGHYGEELGDRIDGETSLVCGQMSMFGGCYVFPIIGQVF
jgi:hypothetical protein